MLDERTAVVEQVNTPMIDRMRSLGIEVVRAAVIVCIRVAATCTVAQPTFVNIANTHDCGVRLFDMLLRYHLIAPSLQRLMNERSCVRGAVNEKAPYGRFFCCA